MKLKSIPALIGFALALIGLPALAQTSPNFTTGQVPSAAQWNQIFANKVDYNVNGCAVTAGCTGVNTVTPHGVVVGNGPNPVNTVAPGTTGFLFTSQGGSADPIWQQLISGSITTGDCTKWLSATTIGDAGVTCNGGGGSGTPGGSNTQLQFNASGVFGGIPGFTWNGTTLVHPVSTFSGTTGFTGTMTLPDGGTHTTALNTFVKVTTDQESGTTAGFPAYTWSSPSAGTFGCAYASATSTFDLGSTSSAGGGCSNSALEWTNGTATLLKSTTVQNLFKVQDTTGATTVATFTDSGAIPQWQLPSTGVISSGGGGISANGASGATWDFGNGTVGDKSGTVQAATANFATAINGPSASGLAVDSWTGPNFKIGQALNVFGGGTMNFAANGGLIGFGGFQNEGLQISGGGPSSTLFPAYYLDPQTAYQITHQVVLLSNVNAAPFVVAGLESGQSDNQSFEIGNVRACNAMLGCVAQLYFLDAVFPPGALQTITVTNPGTGYTQATTTATLTAVGCTISPGLSPSVVVNNATGTVTAIVEHFSSGLGCTSITVAINSTGGGSGAAATATLTTGSTDQSAGPTILWNQGYAGASGPGSQMGLGQCDITRIRCLRLGPSTNTGAAWDFGTATQPIFATAGILEFDNASGGASFSGGEQLSDAGGNVLQIVACTGGLSNKCTSTSTASGLKLGQVTTTAVTVATLPASPVDGMRAFVTDSTVVASGNFGAAVAGTGTNHVPVYYDGGTSTWRIGFVLAGLGYRRRRRDSEMKLAA